VFGEAKDCILIEDRSLKYTHVEIAVMAPILGSGHSSR